MDRLEGKMLTRHQRVFFIVPAVLAVLALWICLGGAPAAAQGEVGLGKNQIRAALAVDQSTAGFYVVQGNYEIRDVTTGQTVGVMPGQGRWTVSPIGAAALYIEFNGAGVQGLGGGSVLLHQTGAGETALFRYQDRRYRGDLWLVNSNGKIQVINVLELEEYLYGVVPREMGSSGIPAEAYKAQAVVSRTYACYSKTTSRNYDVGNTESTQVYGGFDAETQAACAAVDQTRGQVIYYDNQIIQAAFSSNAGGYTEAAENVWSEPRPYLQPVGSPEDAAALNWAQTAEGWPAVTYQWEKILSLPDVNVLIQEWNASHGSDAINIGEFRELKAYPVRMDAVTRQWTGEATQSGRVTRLDFVGSQGTKSFYRDQIRSVLGLRSTLFEIMGAMEMRVMTADMTAVNLDITQCYGVDADGTAALVNEGKGGYFILGSDGVKEIKPGDSSQIIITGRGYGHGVGMSQWGAIG
ncbi:MAG: SpoIID/LytB domain-containing protein, partial [Peptococcaceae bacterium]|nr:SpoIID/LytB domain-containing protein [Peptococcaceae bacterium]